MTNRDRRRLSGRVAIAGADESDEIGIVPHKSTLELHAEAARNALADAGIDMSEVDGVFTAGPDGSPSLQVAEYRGISPKYTDGTAVGGSSFVIHVEHAAAAIEAGLINVALITHGQSGYSEPDRRRARRARLDPTHAAAPTPGPLAFGMPGPRHEDIDVVEVYDSFTYTALATLEALGFCGKGGGGALGSRPRPPPPAGAPPPTHT